MEIKRKLFTKEEHDKFSESKERFKDAMSRCNVEGRLLSIDFKKKVLVKSKSTKGKSTKKAA